ncbi:MAG: glycosyltransferase family 2 protein [Pseudomonadota bacterium]
MDETAERKAYPSVAVVIAAYNASAFIADAVRSALAQTVSPQVIVVDDASTDNTAAIAREAGEGSDRLKVLIQQKNAGPSAARNRAIAATDATWIALLDADDRMAPNRLERLLGYASKNNWDFVADDLLRLTDWANINEAKPVWSAVPFEPFALDLRRFVEENLPANTGHGRELGFIKPIMKRRFLTDRGLRYNTDMRLAEDYDLYARALIAGGKFGLVEAQGYYAFDRPGSLSKQHSAHDLKQLLDTARQLESAPDISDETRAALRDHRRLQHRRWARVHLLEAVRERRWINAMGAFIAPPGVALDLLSMVLGRFTRGSKSNG